MPGPIAPPTAFADLRFPLAGVDRTMGFDRQPNRPMVNGDYARTTVLGINCRAFDPVTDRARGGSRPGVHKYAVDQVNGSNSIQDLNYVTVTNLITGGSGVVPGWGVATPNIFLRKNTSVDLSFGSASAAWSFNSGAFGTGSIAAIGSASGSTVFVVTAAAFGTTPQWQLLSNGSQVAAGNLPGNPAMPSCSVCTDGTNFFCVGQNKGTTAPGLGTFFAIKVTPAGVVSWSTANVGAVTVGQPNMPSTSVVIAGVIYTSFVGTGLVQVNATTGAAGSPLIKVSAATIKNTGTNGNWTMEQGQSSAISVGPTGQIAAVGNTIAIAMQSNVVGNFRKGVAFYDVNAGTFATGIFGDDLTDSTGTVQDNPGKGGNFLVLSQDGTNFYALLGNTNTLQSTTNNFVVKIDGTTKSRLWGSARYGLPTFSMIYSASLSKVVVSGTAVSSFLDPTTGADGAGGLGSNVLGLFDAGSVNTLSSQTADDGSTVGGYNRALCVTAVAGGTLKVLFQSTWQPVLAGGGTISATAKVVRSTVLDRKMYFVDDLGTTTAIYDPVTNQLTAWTPTAGDLPVDSIGKNARLMCTWRARIMQAGLPEDPSNIFASAQNDALNWDYAPSSPSASQAFALNAAGIGQLPDIVTALIPYSDDYLFVGCDHELWRISGDPMAGGKLDLVSRQMGVAWGNAWCTDPFGQIYIFSNHCGIYTLSPNEQPTRISQPIDSLLRDIDLRKVLVRLMWNDRAQGLHVFVTNYGAVSPTTHFFWEQRSGAWWQDKFVDDNMNPLAALTFQGNTGSNRVVLIGSEDGYVRFVTDNAPNDDGQNIESEIWHGPILTKTGDQITLMELQAEMGSDSGPVTWAVHSGATAEAAFAAASLDVGTIYGGRSFTFPTKRSGHAHYIKATSTSQWSMEWMKLKFFGRGMVAARGA